MRTFMRSAKSSLAAAVAALAAIFLTGARAAESLQIEGGQIADTAPNASRIRVFKGIPYAAPPVGELRWKAPQPVQPWNDIRSIAEWGPRCVQSSRLGDLDPLNKRMDEDCLYLNVWTPATSSTQSLPVMVWIHGGSNLNGAGSQPEFDGSHLASKGVVVVTINYRVDVFGFLAHPELTQKIGHEFLRQLRTARSNCRAQVGAKEHTDIRWRPQSGNSVRGVSRCVRRELADGLTTVKGLVHVRNRRERGRAHYDCCVRAKAPTNW